MSPDSRLKRLALATASIFLLVVGAILGIPQMYLMAVAVSLIPLVYWCIGILLLRGIDCERKLPATCQRGDQVKVELVLKNKTFFSRFYVRVLDRLPRWVKFDGYDSQMSGIVLNLSPNEQSKVTYFIRPFRRGLLSIGPTKLSYPDLIGMSNYSRTINRPSELLVYPNVVPINPHFFDGGGAFGWMDQENAATRGTGSDFQGVREYRTGDDLKRVNWKTTARTGSLAVTEYAVGYVTDLIIAFDLSPESYGLRSSQIDPAFEMAVEIAASIAIAGLNRGSSVEFLSNGPLISVDGPLNGAESALNVLTSLAKVQPGSTGSFQEVLDKSFRSQTKNCSLVVITGLSPYNPGSNEALEYGKKFMHGAPAMIFWIDSASFENNGHFRFVTQSQSRRRLPDAYSNLSGTNIVVRPDTDLLELFSKVLT